MKKLMVATLAVGSVWIAAAKSPAESKLFEMFTDPQSGAVSYILKKDAAGFNQHLKTRKESFVFSAMPKYRDKSKSNLHPHPHPQFVCKDKWILTTVIMPGERLSIALAPVDQFK